MSAKKGYIRDKRSPTPKSEVVSKVMSRNKAKDTKPELLLRKALWDAGLKGYRLNYKKIPGRPDIVYVSKKLAIFVNGCYWHRCPKCNYGLPKHNTEFWKEKFRKNTERDARKIAELKELGWQVVVVWECEVKKELPSKVNEIKEFIRNLDRYG